MVWAVGGPSMFGYSSRAEYQFGKVSKRITHPQ
jgi:hypothetical protein